jgi:V/A-type H+-transporting ATPase subunit K
MNRFKIMVGRLTALNTGFIIFASVLLIIGVITLITPLSLMSAEELTSNGQSAAWAFLAAGLSIAVSVIGAGIALSRIGAAAMAALAEKPEIMGSAIVFAGLAEGLSIWGLIVAVLILGKV